MMNIQVIAGPCGAESPEQVLKTAEALSNMGVGIFRAGVWKPRTKPGGFEGVGKVGLEWLKEVRKKTGMRVCTEVATPEHLRLVLEAGIDMFWIGARTAADPFAVQAIADAVKDAGPPDGANCEGRSVSCSYPDSGNLVVLVKNPVNPDVELWSGAVERFRNAGVKNIVLVHRGFSTYDTGVYRNAPLWHIPIEMKRRYPDIPLLCDPSHMGGRRDMIQPICQQALDLMYDGLMVECHITPDDALSDKLQQISPSQLEQIINSLEVRDNRHQNALDSFRNRINELDDSLLKILSERMEVSKRIGLLKQQQNMPVLQTRRYGEIVEKLTEQAAALGLDQRFVQQLLEIIHKESVRVQMEQRKSR